jgi:hypothetical protein
MSHSLSVSTQSTACPIPYFINNCLLRIVSYRTNAITVYLFINVYLCTLLVKQNITSSRMVKMKWMDAVMTHLMCCETAVGTPTWVIYCRYPLLGNSLLCLYVAMEISSTDCCLVTDACKILLMWEVPGSVSSFNWQYARKSSNREVPLEIRSPSNFRTPLQRNW